MTTHRSGPFLRWRYGLPELHYRAIATDDAAVIFRRRRRGPAIEGVIADVLATDDKAGADVVGRLLRQAPADYLLAAGRRQPGLVRLPRQGPILTTRPLADRAPLLRDMRLDLGDIELF